MYQRPKRSRIHELMQRIKRFFKRDEELPDDPYAMVGAPKKPKPPYRRAAAEAELE
jgi:hypothetical protein